MILAFVWGPEVCGLNMKQSLKHVLVVPREWPSFERALRAPF